jgi:hypothetical protein
MLFNVFINIHDAVSHSRYLPFCCRYQNLLSRQISSGLQSTSVWH